MSFADAKITLFYDIKSTVIKNDYSLNFI